LIPVENSLTERLKTRLAALFILAFVACALGTAHAAYQKKFIDTQTVFVSSNRAGLLLEKGSKVKALGLTVGDVRKVELIGADRVRLTLAVESDKITQIPSNAQADISGTTIFGPKYVSLMYPREASVVASLRPNQTIPVSDVGTEINDVLAAVTKVVNAVPPTELNQTLTSVATALQGRGDRLGDLLVNSETYVRALNGEAEAIREDIKRSRGVFDLYADTAPDLLAIADNGAKISRTLDDKRGDLQAAIVGLLAASESGTDLLASSRPSLRTLLSRLRPVLELTDDFAPVLTCTLQAMAIHSADFARSMGGSYPGVTGVASFIPAGSPYTYPKNLPKFLKGLAPTCYGLPEGRDLPPHYMFDDGTKDVYTKGGGPGLADDPVQIYLGLVESFFGTTGLSELLKPVTP